MFNINSAPPSNNSKLETLIACNASVKGAIHFTGTLTIDGSIDGNVYADATDKSVVRVTAKGSVKGEIHSPDIVINGHVKGDIHASGLLVLAADAEVEGNVHYSLVEMEKGAQIRGQLLCTDENKYGASTVSKVDKNEAVQPTHKLGGMNALALNKAKDKGK